MKISLIFGGQGSQKAGMGHEFFNQSAAAKEFFEVVCEQQNADFASVMFEENPLLSRSDWTQSCVLLNAFMAFCALKESVFNSASKEASLGELAAKLSDFSGKVVSLEASFGHSLGEFGALGVSGAFGVGESGLAKAVGLVAKRGEAMMRACEGAGAGMLVVLGLSDEVVINACKQWQEAGKKVWAANFNCDGQIVVAGLRSDLEGLASHLKESGAKRAMLLDMSVASHCPLLQSAADEFEGVVNAALSEQFLPVISNVTAKPYSTKAEASELLKAQLTSPVLYKQSVLASEADVFVEFGTNVLSGINRKVTQKPTFSVTDAASLQAFLDFLRG